MPLMNCNGVEIAYELRGDVNKPVIVLIHGLSMSLIAWPPALLRSLSKAGYTLLLFDNRDMGHSGKMDALGLPNFPLQAVKYKLGLTVNAPYQLEDMMLDAIGLLDGLGINKAHLIGVSMGGMIAQLCAINHPQRFLSLTSIMSTSGKRGLPSATKAVSKHLLSKPVSKSFTDQLNFTKRTWQLIGSPQYPMDPEITEIFVKVLLERGMPRVGTARQTLAILAAKGRNSRLAALKLPSLVIHGKDDPLLPVECGIDTAQSIPNCDLEVIEGMGHDFPPELIPQISQRILHHLKTTSE